VDYPVLLRTLHARDAESVPRLDLLVQRTRAVGSVFVARAFGAWYDLDESVSAFRQGLDPVFVPPAGPGSAPTTTALVADGVCLMRSGEVQALALSGDDRLLPLVAAAHAEGLVVALLAHSCLPDGPCLKLAQLAEPAEAFAHPTTRSQRYRRSVA
jgi:hypothetical protein